MRRKLQVWAKNSILVPRNIAYAPTLINLNYFKGWKMYRYKNLFALMGSLLLASTIALNASSEDSDKKKTAKAITTLTQAGTKDRAEAGISANALIKKAYANIGALKKYSFEATIFNEDDLDGDMMIYLQHNYKVSVVRPDKFRVEVKGDVENRTTYFKDGVVSIIDADNNNYGEVKVSTNIDDALDDLTEI